MHISCPECSTKFYCDTENVNIAAKKLRCSKCQHVWRAEEKQQSNIQDSEHSQPDKDLENNKPFTPADSNPIYLPAIRPSIETNNPTQSLFMLCMVIVTFVLLFSGSIYEKYLFRHKFFTVQEITLNHSDDQDSILQYKIKNNADYTINLPIVRIKMLDKNGQVVSHIKEDYTKYNIAPGKTARVKTKFHYSLEDIYKLNIELSSFW